MNLRLSREQRKTQGDFTDVQGLNKTLMSVVGKVTGHRSQVNVTRSCDVIQ